MDVLTAQDQVSLRNKKTGPAKEPVCSIIGTLRYLMRL